jgi:protein-L-isoaspartate(D-aspartate) O-methyltransferase
MLPLWPCSSSSNEGLVKNLQKAGIVRSTTVYDAMKRTDRALFVPLAVRDEAYQDSPCPIGFSQIISAPHMVRLALQHGSMPTSYQRVLV